MSSLLKTFRTGRDLTQTQLAKASGVAQNTISRIEVLGSCPDFRTAVRLARALGVSVEELFGHLVSRAPRRRTRSSRERTAVAE